MRTFKTEASSLTGSELLSVLIRADGSQTKVDDCVAQVVTIRAGGGGEVTALALAPKTAFQEPVGESWRRPSTAMVEGDWFEQWGRLMVWRPKEGPPNDKRAEAALLTALQRRLERMGPRDKPEAVEALCREVFGERLHELHAILNGSGEMQDDHDLTVDVTRPIDPSELAELLARVPKDWMPVLQRSVEWNTAHWKTQGWNDGGNMETLAKPGCETKRCLYTTAGVLGFGAAVGFLASLLRPVESPQRQVTGEQSGTYEQLSDARAAVVWMLGDPVPVAPCGSGILLCNAGCKNSGNGPWPISFGSPWPASFPLVWNTAHELAPTKCQVLCHTPEETRTSFDARLLNNFPLQPPFNDTAMSREEVLEQILAARTLRRTGWGAAWQTVGMLSDYNCDLANVTCEVMTKSDQAKSNVTLTDLEAPLARVAGSFADYPEDIYDVSNCAYDCWQLTPEAKRIIDANKIAGATRQTTSTTPSMRTTSSKRARPTSKKLTRKDVKYIRLHIG
ncbi:hypothetical protein GNI_154570 [Gregarina niphandrodes]|uniref:Uncharacterized protein n=1 Tax=Gregarina niphandrodes TaxID=110365 RepID=A0A023AZB5_GRENI|nr:hypothetical protein GNI_154570 [Gregarina niphandrodes]EZG43994.1 hypothetical protein GNI_154570 [Gregarina niphandrodes]|eukprot:XP_011132859.1 hypothetical protein GNI_154570 [Gregarina niphandrodes]